MITWIMPPSIVCSNCIRFFRAGSELSRLPMPRRIPSWIPGAFITLLPNAIIHLV